ncbi:LINE-1 retrotransposable element ORF1 protein, partial [Plecturocebus cupreus]
MKMRKNQRKKADNSKNQNASSPPKDHNSLPAREQNWTENEFDELTEEYALTQCKEAKNLERRLDAMLTRISSIEKNINYSMVLTNTAEEFCEAYT